jgi:hypothetical protein
MLKSFKAWFSEFRDAIGEAIYGLKELRDLYRARAKKEEDSLEPHLPLAQKDIETADHFDAVAKQLQRMRHEADQDPPGGPELEDKDR